MCEACGHNDDGYLHDTDPIHGRIPIALRAKPLSHCHCGAVKDRASQQCNTCHRLEQEQRRSTARKLSAHARGYDRAHRELRAGLQPFVDAGLTFCTRCSKRIQPGATWHLDHDDNDRTKHLGPAHQRCNVIAGQTVKKASKLRKSIPPPAGSR